MKKKNAVKTSLMYLLGISILIALTYKVGYNKIISILSSIETIYIPLIVLLFGLTLLAGASNIWILLRSVKRLSFWKTIKYYCISWSIGLIAPSKIGEFSIIYFLKKEDIEIGKGLAIVVLDKFITFMLLLVFASIGLFIFFPLDIAIIIFVIILCIGIITAISLYSFSGRNFIRKFILRKYSPLLTGFGLTNKGFFNENLHLILINGLLTIARFFLAALSGYVTFISLGTKVGYIYVLLIFTIAQLLSLIPISINGLGIRELTNVYIYTKIGIASQTALSRSLIALIIMYAYGITIFFISGTKSFYKNEAVKWKSTK